MHAGMRLCISRVVSCQRTNFLSYPLSMDLSVPQVPVGLRPRGGREPLQGPRDGADRRRTGMHAPCRPGPGQDTAALRGKMVPGVNGTFRM